MSLADRRAGLFEQDPDAPHIVAVDVGPPEQPGSLASRSTEHHAYVEVSEEAAHRDLDIIAFCRSCRETTMQRRRSGVWTCAGCAGPERRTVGRGTARSR